MNEREALRLALEALGHFEKAGLTTLRTIDAITAIKQALTQPEQEPVAWIINGDLEELLRYGRRALVLHLKPITYGIETPLYTSPPKREWQGLTEREVDECYQLVMHDMNIEPSRLRIYQAIEAKLKERNT